MLPKVFRYGYATPFYNLSRTVLTICFNTKNESEPPTLATFLRFSLLKIEIVGTNFGVQVVWIAVSVCTLVIFQWFVCRRDRNVWEKKIQVDV